MTTFCFLSSTRYSQPLDGTSEKKFRALRVLGEAFVIGFSHDLRPRRFTEHAHFYLLSNLPIPGLRYLEMLLVGPLLMCWLILRHGVRIVVAQGPYQGFAGVLSKKIVKLFGRRVVLVVENHGDFDPESLFLQRRIYAQALYRFLMTRIRAVSLRHADLLRPVSYVARKQFERSMPGKLTVQFPAWTDIDEFLKAGANKQACFCRDVLYAGMLIPRKGVHYLINAFARICEEFPRARLVLVGAGDNSAYVATLQSLVQQLRLKEYVQFVGAVTQPQLAACMSRASVFVLPSLSEGLPRVVLEAMATATPVVASDVGGIPEVVDNGSTGFLVPPGDESALTERLREVLGSPAKASEMGYRAREFVDHFFSTTVYVNGYRRLFDAAQTVLFEDRNASAVV